MLYRTTLLVLFLLSCAGVYGQTNQEFSQELTEKEFTPVKKNKLPDSVIKLLGYDSRDVVGTEMSQTGCTSGKRIVINWAVTDKDGFYVLKTATCGAWTETVYYIIANGTLNRLNLSVDYEDFTAFKTEYLKPQE